MTHPPLLPQLPRGLSLEGHQSLLGSVHSRLWDFWNQGQKAARMANQQ